MKINDTQIDPILRQPAILRLLSIHSTTLWRWVKDDKFPKSTKYGARVTGWRLSVVEAWLESKENDNK